MKLAGIVALLLGLLAGTLLIAHYGVAAVAEALLTIGWSGFLLIILLHLAILFLCGIAWFVLVPPAVYHFLSYELGPLGQDQAARIFTGG